MRLRGMRRSQNAEDRHPMDSDGAAVIGGVGLPVVLAIGREAGEMGQSDICSANRP